MFFTKFGFVIAWLMTVPHAIAFAVAVIPVWTGNVEWAQQTFGPRFMASSGTFLMGIGIGVAFGIASEISRSITARP